MWSAVGKPFPKTSQDKSCSAITGCSTRPSPMVCLWGLDSASLLWTLSSGLLLAAEWGVNCFHCKEVSRLFVQSKAEIGFIKKTPYCPLWPRRPVTAQNCVCGICVVWEVGRTWLWKQKFNCYLYADSIYESFMQHMCKWEQNMTQHFGMKSRYP